jgi:hypothetical protein
VTRALTRRALLQRGATAGLWLVAGRTATAASIRRPIVRAVALGPGGIGVEQSYAANRNRFIDTGTPWVRLWADWSVAQPTPDALPDLSELDAALAQAKADGLRVMVTAWRSPPWASGATASGELHDRIAPGADPASRKDVTFKIPADLAPGGAWGRWLDLLITRYAGKLDALEIVNEPNLQLWPQQGPSTDPADAYGSGPLTIDAAVATMMQTASAIAARHDRPPLLVGPATSDSDGDSRLQTRYDTFTHALLRRLAERGFRPGPSFAWSHHNYNDVEGDLAGPANRVAQVRALLQGDWAGWPSGDAAQPGVLITESGARVDKVAGLPEQASALEANLGRMLTGPEGEGVGMVCQYLFVTDAHYDSGLCGLDGTPRPAYYAWSRTPTAR